MSGVHSRSLCVPARRVSPSVSLHVVCHAQRRSDVAVAATVGTQYATPSNLRRGTRSAPFPAHRPCSDPPSRSAALGNAVELRTVVIAIGLLILVAIKIVKEECCGCVFCRRHSTAGDDAKRLGLEKLYLAPNARKQRIGGVTVRIIHTSLKCTHVSHLAEEDCEVLVLCRDCRKSVNRAASRLKTD